MNYDDDRALSEVLRKIKRIEILTRRLVNDVFSGEYHSVFKGHGMEFDEVREYQPGDEIRSIDWNVTARMGSPYVKRYMEERELVVVFLLDVSASGRFGSVENTKIETAAETCALLAFSAIQNNDKVGPVMFNADVEQSLPPDMRPRHCPHATRALHMLNPRGRWRGRRCSSTGFASSPPDRQQQTEAPEPVRRHRRGEPRGHPTHPVRGAGAARGAGRRDPTEPLPRGPPTRRAHPPQGPPAAAAGNRTGRQPSRNAPVYRSGRQGPC